MPILRRLTPFLIVLSLAMAPGAGHAAEAKKKGGGLSYIQLQPLTVTVFLASGRRGGLTVETGVDVPNNGGLHARAEASQPRLQAAYLLLLQAYASGLTPGSPPDADYIARSLQRETDRVLGQPGAKLLVGTILVN
jgi:hypothetical protein